jgi:hypothetical protein
MRTSPGQELVRTYDRGRQGRRRPTGGGERGDPRNSLNLTGLLQEILQSIRVHVSFARPNGTLYCRLVSTTA